MTTYYGLRMKATGIPLVIDTEDECHYGELCGFKQYLTQKMNGNWIEDLYLNTNKELVERVRNNTNTGVTLPNYGVPHHYENPDDLEIFEVNI